MQPLVKAAVDCVTDGRTQFVPERFTKNYTGWMETFTTGASAVRFGGGTAFLFGTAMTAAK